MRFNVWRKKMSSQGQTFLKSYPYMEKEDIREALQYASFLANEKVIEFVA